MSPFSIGRSVVCRLTTAPVWRFNNKVRDRPFHTINELLRNSKQPSAPLKMITGRRVGHPPKDALLQTAENGAYGFSSNETDRPSVSRPVTGSSGVVKPAIIRPLLHGFASETPFGTQREPFLLLDGVIGGSSPSHATLTAARCRGSSGRCAVLYAVDNRRRSTAHGIPRPRSHRANCEPAQIIQHGGRSRAPTGVLNPAICALRGDAFFRSKRHIERNCADLVYLASDRTLPLCI